MEFKQENLILHPVRMRIIIAASGRQFTAQQLANELPDIPQASLYRNINALAGGGILKVVQERRTRNTIEKVYALQDSTLRLNPEELARAKPEDHMRIYTQYLGMMLGYFSRYVSQENIDYARDGVGYQLLPLNLTKAEFVEFVQALNSVLMPFIKMEPAADRQRYILGLNFLPDVTNPYPKT